MSESEPRPEGFNFELDALVAISSADWKKLDVRTLITFYEFTAEVADQAADELTGTNAENITTLLRMEIDGRMESS